jgi:formiminoglutamase
VSETASSLLQDLLASPDARDPRATSLLRPAAPDTALARARVLLGLPYDGGIPSRPGARFGPKALREALGAFGAHTGEEDSGAAYDLGDLSLPSMNGAEAHRRIEDAARRVFAAGARPIFVGGDHGCTGSIVRGLAAARPALRLAVINIDPHLDVREYADEASLSSGTPFRRALETAIVDGSRMATIGVRRFANSRYYLDWARDRGMHLFWMDEIEERGPVAVARRALEAVMKDADALYLSVDLDAADAAHAPGVSAAGVGGLTARELIALVREIAGTAGLVAADIMELSPPYDPDGRSAKLAARLLLELLAAPQT